MMPDKRSLIEDILKLAMEHRANGLKSKLSPPMDMMAGKADDPNMPGDPEESASGMPTDPMMAGGGGDGEPDPDMLKKLLEMMGGSDGADEAQ